MELMDGKIIVDSILGHGSTFEITLPVTRDAQRATPQTLEPKIEEISMVDLYDHMKDSSKDLPVLLLVEDSEEITNLLIALLHHDYQIESARDGIEGLNIVVLVKVVPPDN